MWFSKLQTFSRLNSHFGKVHRVLIFLTDGSQLRKAETEPVGDQERERDHERERGGWNVPAVSWGGWRCRLWWWRKARELHTARSGLKLASKPALLWPPPCETQQISDYQCIKAISNTHTQKKKFSQTFFLNHPFRVLPISTVTGQPGNSRGHSIPDKCYCLVSHCDNFHTKSLLILFSVKLPSSSSDC